MWGLRDQNIGIEQVKHDQYVLMWAAKWLGEKKVLSDTIFDHRHTYLKNKRDSSQIAKSIWKLMDEADITVTQNGDNFDLKWLNQLWLLYGLPQPSKSYSIDLLKHSRRGYYSISHKLDFRCRQLILGSKIAHQGFSLWKDCMAGVGAAFSKMREYCEHDVILTEKYYLKLRSRIPGHPNVNMFNEQPFGGRLKCPACGSPNMVRFGFMYMVSGRKQRFGCKDCGHRSVEACRPDPITKPALRSV